MTDETATQRKEQRYARLLDLRFIIAIMFTIFGVLVLLAGITSGDEAEVKGPDDLVSQEAIDNAATINISLWSGIGMLVLAAAFALWVAKAPPETPTSSEDLDKE